MWINGISHKLLGGGTSLAVQWLTLHLPMQGVPVSIPVRGAKMPHASQPKNENIKQKQYCKNSMKNFKNGPHRGFPGGTVVENLPANAGDTVSSPGL